LITTINGTEVLKKQFETQKELYVTPAIIALSALPQAILTFSFACTQLSDWQRHTLLASYLAFDQRQLHSMSQKSFYLKNRISLLQIKIKTRLESFIIINLKLLL
jgi:hypothetical protein